MIDAPEGAAVIVEVGAEGGSITLYGRRLPSGGWEFARVTEDQTWMFDPDVDPEGSERLSTTPDLRPVKWVREWAQALVELDKHPWPRLTPIKVHAEFRTLIWDAVLQRIHGSQDRYARLSLENWARLLGMQVPPGNA